MQSSTAVLFRALVLLACLVAVPLAAVIGSSLPDLARGLLARWTKNGESTCDTTLDEAPAFVPGSPVTSPLAQLGVDAAPAQAQDSVWEAPAWGNRPAEAFDPAVVPAAGMAALGSESATTGLPWPPASISQAPLDRAAPPDDGLSPANSADGLFVRIQQRLRQLGATYFALESWGNSDQLYRFQCKMAVDGNPNFTRHFEATDPQPLTAMALVLEQVEAWQSAAPRTAGRWQAE